MLFLKTFYFFLVIVYSGMALPFFRSHEGLIVLWLVGLIIFWNQNMRPRKVLFIALGVWLIFFLINTVTIKSFHPFFLGTYIAKLMIAYWIITQWRLDFFRKYEDILYVLATLSLVIYVAQIAFPSLVYGLLNVIDLSQDLFPGKYYASIGVYTFHQPDLSVQFPRNSGFAWEPGPFSCFVALALFVNTARHGGRFSDAKRVIIFVATLFTTQSTTGAALLFVILSWHAWHRYRSYFIRAFAISITVSLLVITYISVPWLGEKVALQANQDPDDLLIRAEKSGNFYNPGRFASLSLSLRDYMNYPIAGFGGNPTLRVGYLGDENVVSPVGGIGNLIARYGTIGATIFLLLIIRSGAAFSRHYGCRAHFIFPILIILSGFGFSIVESPILVSFWVSSFFLPREDRHVS